MPSQWLSSSSDFSARLSGGLESAVHQLSQPERVARLRRLVLLLLALWLAFSAVRLFWALFPTAEAPALEAKIINPVGRPAPGGSGRSPVDIAALRGQHLFGEVDQADQADQALVDPALESAEVSREGIEEGARETRLQVTLRGVVASTEDGLGHAIIEHQSQQEVYAVGDELPVANGVSLAKVLPRQVVLDNNGTYELLTLFEESELDAQASALSRPPPPAPRPAPAQGGKRAEQAASDIATGYRDRLYQDPQSLAEVVAVSAVRQKNGELLGYRVSPGKDRAQFAQLGFEAGDLVTRVNGITLDDPANTMRLYQTMRTASEAVFDLQRGGEQVSISISLDQEGQ